MRDFETSSVVNDKRSRTFMTTSGMKTFRVTPTTDNSTISKYQTRSEKMPTSTLPHPLTHSTPKPPDIKSSQIIRSRPSSCQLERKNLSKSFKNSRKTSLSLPPSTPSPVFSATTSASSHSTTFTVRSASCTPPHLYMAEHVRAGAKLRQPRFHSCSGQYVKPNKIVDKNGMPDRFGEPVLLPAFVKSNPHLKHSQLSMGQKQYLWGIARIYSVGRLKKLKQKQYQSLLDYEFKRRLEKMGLKEREKVKEMKDYIRYTKFINTYEQRIPRNLRSSESRCQMRVANHIHKHPIKGWTTNGNGLSRYSEQNLSDSQETLELVESEEKNEVKTERGAHIYKHVIKGWTMDPNANDAYRPNNTEYDDDEDSEHEISLSDLENSLKEDVSVYSVEISRSSDKNHEQGDVMKIVRINRTFGESKQRSRNDGAKNGSQVDVSLQDSAPTDSNVL